MRKLLIAVILFLIASLSFANDDDDRCDKQSNKAKAEQCYKALVTERKEALDEYYEAIVNSNNIPQNVKEQVARDYQSFMKNIFSFCPDNSCVSRAMMEQIKDMYNDTRKYTIPQ